MVEQDDIFDAIAEFNHAYLAFAQRVLRSDSEYGKQLFGLADDKAASIAALTPAQIGALSDRADMLCAFQLEAAPGRA
ncbi:flagellar transcriptional activator [Burkholderia sp. lig30]|jgi:flagellar transcriptional activator FlhD|uniref:flagellar transcriptional regulator FlhD n=1 Tax=Burkholderia sp. lig30 TaxID=1192124 RepID=UPI0004618CEB|nr:flagellar transcriptional regulator FlhD [Burkholderia sp. lig30]KDB09718.1 flagellar transcriptional activator [Burkholderia sp. lig30]